MRKEKKNRLESEQVHVLPISLATLRSLVIFSSLDDERLSQLLPHCRLLAYPRHHVVLRAGEKTSNIFFLLSGLLRVLREANNRDAVLSTLHPGEIFGEMGALDDSPRSADIRTVAPSRIVVISRQAFQDCIANVHVLLFIIRGLIRRLRDADRRITSLASYDVNGRVTRYLLSIAQQAASRGEPPEIIATQADIAGEIGATREMVAKSLHKLVSEGLVTMSRKRITVLDHQELAQVYKDYGGPDGDPDETTHR